jgi:hypothetical protein
VNNHDGAFCLSNPVNVWVNVKTGQRAFKHTKRYCKVISAPFQWTQADTVRGSTMTYRLGVKTRIPLMKGLWRIIPPSPSSRQPR